jgi:hypothetical protein
LGDAAQPEDGVFGVGGFEVDVHKFEDLEDEGFASYSTIRALACLSAFGSCGFTLTFAEFPVAGRLMFCPLMSNNVSPALTDDTKVRRRGKGLGLERGWQPQKIIMLNALP